MSFGTHYLCVDPGSQYILTGLGGIECGGLCDGRLGRGVGGASRARLELVNVHGIVQV